jgi:hypothetical protein
MGIVRGWGTALVETKGQIFFFQFFVSMFFINFYLKKEKKQIEKRIETKDRRKKLPPRYSIFSGDHGLLFKFEF